jgi:hypothetical protein
MDANRRRSLIYQLVPRAIHGVPNADQRRQQDVHLAGLDFLVGADVQVGEFAEARLCHSFRAAFAAGDASGGFNSGFMDITGPIIVMGNGDTITNYLDIGVATNTPARYDRVRLVP